MIARGLAALLMAYKRRISPLLPRACRFTPTCSEFSRVSLLKHGLVGGLGRSAARIARCHPLHPGGVDLP